VRLEPGRYVGTWFEAATGARVAVPPFVGGPRTSLTAPGANDWALLLERQRDSE